MDFRDIVKRIGNFFTNSFGQNKSFLVDSSNPLVVTDENYTIIEVLSDATGVSIKDANVTGGTSYPTDLLAGFRTYGKFTSVTCSTGVIKVYESR